jgi:flagellar biosynthesis protein FlhA
VLVTHLLEVIRKHSAELLTRQQVHKLVDHLKTVAPKVVEELVPQPLSTAELHQVLRNLLKERVPIRDLEAILTTLGDYVTKTKDLDLLSEAARLAVARTICQKYRDPRDGVLRVVTLDPHVESVLAEGAKRAKQGLRIDVSPQTAERVVQVLATELQPLVRRGCHPVVVCSPGNRRGLKLMTEADLPELAVLSTNEITVDVDVEALGQVSLESFQGALAG